MAAGNSNEMPWGWQSKMSNSSERGKYVLEKDFHSDVTFRVGPIDGETDDIKAHKFVLATASTVFESMFYGNLAETKSIIPITDIDPDSFRVLLRYLYHQQIGPFDTITAFPTLYAAKKYGLPTLKDACERYLRGNVTVENCLRWLVQAEFYDEPKLAVLCLATIDSKGPLVLKSADFLEVNNGTLAAIFSRDSFKVREIDVFDAAVRWAKNRCEVQQMDGTGVNLRAALGNALFQVRLPILTSDDVELGPVKLGLLLDAESEQLRRWYASKTLPESFNTTRRRISTELPVTRFGGRQDGWTYAPGRPNGIPFCITSVTDKTNWNVDSASISLVAVGFYLSSVVPIPSVPIYQQCEESCPHCGAISRVTREVPGAPQPSPTISLKVYIYEAGDQRELVEFRHTFFPPSSPMGDRVWKISLSKPVPLKLYQRYTLSANMTGIQQSYYGTEGKSSVTKATSSGDYNVTVQFSSMSEVNGSQLCGDTTAALGQFPELYFEVIG